MSDLAEEKNKRRKKKPAGLESNDSTIIYTRSWSGAPRRIVSQVSYRAKTARRKGDRMRNNNQPLFRIMTFEKVGR